MTEGEDLKLQGRSRSKPGRRIVCGGPAAFQADARVKFRLGTGIRVPDERVIRSCHCCRRCSWSNTPAWFSRSGLVAERLQEPASGISRRAPR